MNPNKICFIYQVSNEIVYNESLQYLQSLHLPEGFEVELLECRDNGQVLKDYNEAMQSSDAKYKVYIRDNVFVINKHFIDDLLELFNKNPQLGMIGVIGAKTPPLSGNWKDSNHKFGKILEKNSDAIQLTSYERVAAGYESVCLLDGMVLATQFDIPWREDLLKGDSFIGESQSLEFLKAGFEVGVPAQANSWCSLFDSSPNHDRLGDKKVFLREYSNLLFPKVSILIPTYNRPQYFEQALQSVLGQTYQHIEIIVCDDSTNDETKELINKYVGTYPQIRYHKNERNVGQFLNDLQCLELATGDFVNFLMDDDLFHPQKIEKMMEYYLGDDGEEITLVTSHRELIDRDGNLIPNQALTKRVFDEDTIVPGSELANQALVYNWNFIGEPTTVLFRKSDLIEPFGVFFDREYQCNVDMATWLNLLSQGKGVYIAQTLSYFRIHDDQQLQSNKMILLGAADYAHEIIFAPNKGFLQNEKDYDLAVRNCLNYVEEVMHVLENEPKQLPQYNELLHLFGELKHLSVQGKPLVSVLIPAYNRPRLLEQALQSVLTQTYPNIEIIICDDSTNDDVYNMIIPYLERYPHIQFHRNETNLGQFQNDLKLFEHAQGEYVNFLMDDDLFHPNKIEKMMDYFINDTNKEITLVTSHRQIIDEEGNPYSVELKATEKLFNENTLIDGIELGNYILTAQMNVIGEPTTVLFRKEDLEEPFGTFNGREYGCNVDMASWVNLLAKGKAVYIAETLSYFRVHKDQQQWSPRYRVLGLLDVAHQILNADRKGFLQAPQLFQMAIANFTNVLHQLEHMLSESDKESIAEFQELQFYYGLLKEKANSLVKEQPLVSVLIPAYNRPRMLEEALQSVLNQTYKNVEIIICDDSTNNEVENMIQPYLSKYSHIQYYKNEKNLALGNIYKLYDKARGEFISYLMDDDLFHKEKIEKMVNYLVNYSDVTLVTSQRTPIDEAGNILPHNEDTKKLFDKDTIVDGITAGNVMLETTRNIVGEPTTAMFRRKDIVGKFGNYKNIEYNVINDVAAWISLLAKGKLVYIADSLSYFRQHKNQNQRNPELLYLNIKQWLDIIMSSREDGFLQQEKQYIKALDNYLKLSLKIINIYNSINRRDILRRNKVYEQCSTAMKLLANHEDHYICPFCENRFSRMNAWPDQYDTDMIFEMYNKHSICPVCVSMDRERLYRVYIQNETDLLSTNNTVLHIAPERNLKSWLSSISSIKYICGDLYPTDSSIIKMDITDIPYPDNHFDVILCSHVLEHIPNDRAAMKELLRVLKPGGWGIVQVPIAMELECTFEDPSIVTPEDRLRVFGQEDHVRIYASDYVERLKESGFRVEIFNLAAKSGLEEASRYGLSETSNLYIVHKTGSLI